MNSDCDNSSDKAETPVACLIDFDQKTENIEKCINAHYHSEENLNHKQGSWGVYQFKPKSQQLWENSVRNSVRNICSVDNSEIPQSDLRPRVFDQHSGLSILLDTGACCSIWPRRYFPDLAIDPHKSLVAVNGTRIPTFGYQIVEIHPKYATKPYKQKVIVAKVDQPILGFDFIIAYKLNLQWSGKNKCRLVDTLRNQSMPLTVDTVNKDDLGLALVTFKQYSQLKSEQNSKNEPKYQIPSEYQAIIDKYPGRAKSDISRAPQAWGHARN